MTSPQPVVQLGTIESHVQNQVDGNSPALSAPRSAARTLSGSLCSNALSPVTPEPVNGIDPVHAIADRTVGAEEYTLQAQINAVALLQVLQHDL